MWCNVVFIYAYVKSYQSVCIVTYEHTHLVFQCVPQSWGNGITLLRNGDELPVRCITEPCP